MTAERIPAAPAEPPRPAIHAEPEALEHYQGLDPRRRAALDALIQRASEVTLGRSTRLWLDWWEDAEDEDWQMFVLRARTAYEQELALFYDLVAVEEEIARRFPDLANWLKNSVRAGPFALPGE